MVDVALRAIAGHGAQVTLGEVCELHSVLKRSCEACAVIEERDRYRLQLHIISMGMFGPGAECTWCGSTCADIGDHSETCAVTLARRALEGEP